MLREKKMLGSATNISRLRSSCRGMAESFSMFIIHPCHDNRGLSSHERSLLKSIIQRLCRHGVRSTTYRVSNRTGIVGFAINEVSTVNDIVKSCNLAGELSVSAAILIGSPPILPPAFPLPFLSTGLHFVGPVQRKSVLR